eukprot:CAMPEP_0119064168 /NCGR_PEP_ID=MMETSP1178-20130426/7327_1 /TAXON_ID=33656 /ORGANISM="unid sp, Strain CCMP2000" /LENGTH=211 /DNA_ID=CAMNT_0007045591 /DNA_START=68 /DNA_END=700 /DNA_ORIENTATION=+
MRSHVASIHDRLDVAPRGYPRGTGGAEKGGKPEAAHGMGHAVAAAAVGDVVGRSAVVEAAGLLGVERLVVGLGLGRTARAARRGGAHLPAVGDLLEALLLVPRRVRGGEMRVVQRRGARGDLGAPRVDVAQVEGELLHLVSGESGRAREHVEVRGAAGALEAVLRDQVKVEGALVGDVGVDHSAARHVAEGVVAALAAAALAAVPLALALA